MIFHGYVSLPEANSYYETFHLGIRDNLIEPGPSCVDIWSHAVVSFGHLLLSSQLRNCTYQIGTRNVVHFWSLSLGQEQFNVGKTMPFAPSPSHHHVYRWYVYHSQSWVVYGIVLPTLYAMWLLLLAILYPNSLTESIQCVHLGGKCGSKSDQNLPNCANVSKCYSKMWNLYVEIFVSGIQNKKLTTCIQTWQHQAETIFTNAN